MRTATYMMLALALLLLGSAAGAFLYDANPAAATPMVELLPPTPETGCELEQFYQRCFVDGVDYSEFRYPVLMRMFLTAHAAYPDALITGYGVGNPIRLELVNEGQPLAYCWGIAPLLAEKQVVAGYYMEDIEPC